MLQARMSESDQRLYSPNRDVAHNFGEILRTVLERSHARPWTDLNAIADAAGVDDAAVGKACQALAEFVGTQCTKKESMGEALERCGWMQLPAVSRIVVMTYLGMVTLGVHWAGVREATLGTDGPALTYRRLAHEGRICSLLMTMPLWKRKIYLVYRRVRSAWRSLFSNRSY